MKRTVVFGGLCLSVVIASACERRPVEPRGGLARGPAADAGADAASDASAKSDAGAAHARAKGAPERESLSEMPDKVLCALPKESAGATRPGARPYERAPGECPEPFCDFVETPPKGGGACFVANVNIARAEREGRGAGRGAPLASSPWDHKTPPKWLDRVDAHLHLSGTEAGLLRANGFVALDRLAYGSYAVAFHDVFQQQLPVYVSADAILNAVFHASQTVLEEVERKTLAPRLVSMLGKLRTTLRASRGRYATETWNDLDVYVTVAASLLRPNEGLGTFGKDNQDAATDLVTRATASKGLEELELFGRTRMIDFTQYTPRGHYASYEPLSVGAEPLTMEGYFRALTWLSRLELNVASRSCRSSQPGAAPDPRETPREARDAIALADLVSRAGALGDLRLFEDTYAVFAGRREDLSVSEILALSQKARLSPSDADADVKLRAALGDAGKRTARTHYMPEGAGELPAIATLFGPRIVPDIAPLTGLVHDRLPGRDQLGAADVAFLLGHDRAKHYLGAELATHGGLAAALDKGRTEMAAGVRGKRDVYATWLGAVMRLADKPEGVVPSFMRTSAYEDMRMSSALAGYAQIRHTFVLLAGQAYDAYGCEIPDGYVEPAIGTYDALLAWARAARSAAPGKAAYFRRAEAVFTMLKSISERELSGAPLTEPQRRWLSMISEHTPTGGYGGDSGAPPKWTGWYFDLFPDREHGAERAVDLVADYATLTNAGQVRYLGVEKATMGVFVVDTGGEARAMVGPVAKTYETASPISARLDDRAARAVTAKASPWSASYTAPAPAEPPIETRLVTCGDEARMIVSSPADLGAVTVTLLDHHGDPITSSVTRDVGGGPVAFAFSVSDALRGAAHGLEGAHVHVHDLARAKLGVGRWDFVAGVSVYPVATGYPRPFSSYGMDVALGSLAPPAPEER